MASRSTLKIGLAMTIDRSLFAFVDRRGISNFETVRISDGIKPMGGRKNLTISVGLPTIAFLPSNLESRSEFRLPEIQNVNSVGFRPNHSDSRSKSDCPNIQM
ncbi:unnamed protein product [Anisakis simplex]|uniref:Riboflavin kinase n=1 Tax=Anisakis simplex TaxID=6269 RepID=A0A0M3JJV9_ANISI|nr:unnamed protein product [Anisakis simplex]